MEQTGFDLESYLSKGVEDVVKELVRMSLFHPRESAFMARYAAASRRAAHLRAEAEERGEHVPPFLIASIALACNLHCAGCYARFLQGCGEGESELLPAETWERIFREAAELGVGFILLAGGEPLLRRDVLERAACFPELLFPVFTNGTLLQGETLELFDRSRNLVPVLSLEGGRETTDERRGPGVYRALEAAMESLKQRRIAFGASVTVTRENLREVTGDGFLEDLHEKGCKAVIFVEYVPTDESTLSLAPGETERALLDDRVQEIRRKGELLVLSFPGDEKSSGGCLAAGRGFFHINARGGVEPCPFSPYSDRSLKDCSLKEALNSPLFKGLREGGYLREEHEGGCVLFPKRDEVAALAAETGKGGN